MSFDRLVRFVPASDSNAILIGEPVDANLDVGLAIRKGDEVEVKVFSGKSALNPGSLSDKTEKIARLLSPLSQEEVGTIRCIGLNVSFQSTPDAVPNIQLLTQRTVQATRRRSQDGSPTRARSLPQASHLPRRPLPSTHRNPQAHQVDRHCRLRIRTRRRHLQALQERFRGRGPRLRPGLHRRKRRFQPCCTIRSESMVLQQGLRRCLSDRSCACELKVDP